MSGRGECSYKCVIVKLQETELIIVVTNTNYDHTDPGQCVVPLHRVDKLVVKATRGDSYNRYERSRLRGSCQRLPIIISQVRHYVCHVHVQYPKQSDRRELFFLFFFSSGKSHVVKFAPISKSKIT